MQQKRYGLCKWSSLVSKLYESWGQIELPPVFKCVIEVAVDVRLRFGLLQVNMLQPIIIRFKLLDIS